jgi:hypothetical protein
VQGRSILFFSSGDCGSKSDLRGIVCVDGHDLDADDPGGVAIVVLFLLFPAISLSLFLPHPGWPRIVLPCPVPSSSSPTRSIAAHAGDRGGNGNDDSGGEKGPKMARQAVGRSNPATCQRSIRSVRFGSVRFLQS